MNPHDTTDFADLKTAAQALQKELKQRPIRLNTKGFALKRVSYGTDGWAVVIGRTTSPKLYIELWLDYWSNLGRRYFAVCFYSETKGPMDQLLDAVPSDLQPVRIVTGDDVKTIQKKDQLRTPLSAKHLNRPILEDYGECYYGLFDRRDAPTKDKTTLDVRRSASFVVDVIKALERSQDPATVQIADKPPIRRSHEERKAIEDHAMEIARKHLQSQGFTVQDHSKGKPYDYLATKNGEDLSVEVKGRTTDEPRSIILTIGEVKHQNSVHPLNALILVSGIKLSRTGNGPIASGGEVEMTRGWKIDTSKLKAITFDYEL